MAKLHHDEKTLLFGLALAASLSFRAQAQTDSPKVFEIVGTEIPVSNLPNLKGRWFNPANNSGQIFRYQDGFAYVWNPGRCGEDKRKILKAYQQGTLITVETGPSTDQIRCNLEFGSFQSVDTSTKKGTYGIKVSKETNEISRTGLLTLD